MDNWNGIGSLLIACVEILLLINLLIFAEKNKLNRIAIVMIALLAGYQAMEFLMCGIELQNSFFPYFAFVIISFLPPSGLLLVLTLTRSHTLTLNLTQSLIFLPAVVFVIYYTFIIPQFAVTSCAVLYASYNYPLGELYGLFYYLPVLITIIILVISVRKSTNSKVRFISKILLTGNIIVSIPVITGFILMFTGNYYLILKIESIMCKFAFAYAVCLAFVCLHNPKKKIN